MKKLYAFLIGLLMILSVFAAQEGIHEPGTGIDDPALKSENQGTGQGLDSTTGNNNMTGKQTAVTTALQVNQQNQGDDEAIQNREQVRNQIQELKNEMEQKRKQMNVSGEKNQNSLKNQNQVRIAAQTLSQMEEMIGSRGKEISTIAKDFDNSIQSTIKSEEQIQTRSKFSRFFAGGDKKAAEEIEGEVTKNQERIKELKQLKEQAECPEEVKEMVQEQIQQMEQEQTRLQTLAQQEKKSKGLLGWIWK